MYHYYIIILHLILYVLLSMSFMLLDALMLLISFLFFQLEELLLAFLVKQVW